MFSIQLNQDDMKIRHFISKRDDTFFIKEKPFSFMSGDRVDKLGALWSSGVLEEDDKDVLWSWVDSFVKISDKYTEL